MNKNRKISGCIVTYNNEDCIESCVRTILQHTSNENFTLYVSDNGSTDNTLKIIEESFPQIIIIKNNINGGFGYGHNQVIKLLDSEYHFVINPDISIDCAVITELVSYMEQNLECAMITPQIVNLDGTEQHLPKRNPTIRYLIISKFGPFKKYRKLYTRETEKLNDITSVDFCTGCFFGIRTSVFKELKGFDKRFFMYFEDADLSRRVREKYQIIFYPYTYVYHAWHRDNTRSFKGILRWGRSMIKYFGKWGWKF